MPSKMHGRLHLEAQGILGVHRGGVSREERKRSKERRGKPTPAWSVTELADDDSTDMGGSETPEPIEYEMSMSSVQTTTGKYCINLKWCLCEAKTNFSGFWSYIIGANQ